jgi:uncharacterized cupin superfamily protein
MTWFIRNIRDVQWFDEPRSGSYGDFQQAGEPFPDFGFNFGIVHPGQPVALYHREDDQEGFLVLSGECLLIVEGEERPLRQWDYFHCPAGTDHILVGAGDAPAFVIAVGGRTRRAGGTVYPVDAAAIRHGAGVERETTDPKLAYASFDEPRPLPFSEALLPAVGPVGAPRSSGGADRG